MKGKSDQREDCVNQYFSLKRSITEIAQANSCSRSFVYKLLKDSGRPLRTLSEAQQLSKCSHVSLSNEALEFLSGLLLGDGHLTHSDRASSAYDHGSKHAQFLSWLSKRLSGFGISQAGRIFKQIGQTYSPITKKRYCFTCFHYRSRLYIELRDLWARWYVKNGKTRKGNVSYKKKLPEDLKLTSLVCKQWYLGDGSLAKNNSITLSTQSFSSIELSRLIDYLGALEFKVTKHATGQIYIGAQSARDFLDFIGPCPEEIREIYSYKW